MLLSFFCATPPHARRPEAPQYRCSWLPCAMCLATDLERTTFVSFARLAQIPPPPPSAVPLLRLPAAPDSTVNPATVCRYPEQVNRIVRITVTGNVFFAIRAACELTVGWALYKHYKRELLSCTKAVSDGLRKRIDGGSVGTGSNCLR